MLGRDDQPARFNDGATRLHFQAKGLLDWQSSRRGWENEPHRSGQCFADPCADLKRRRVVLVSLYPGWQIGGLTPAVLNHLLVTQSVDRVDRVLRLGDGDADAACFGDGEHCFGETV
jgi:hypothetical protein